MPFSLTNALVTFQAYTHKALRHLNDILIYSKDEKEHKHHIKIVLQKLRDYALYTKPSKCTFHTKEVKFLGFIVNTNGVIIDKNRVRSICE
jgi:hypothetical protein